MVFKILFAYSLSARKTDIRVFLIRCFILIFEKFDFLAIFAIDPRKCPKNHFFEKIPKKRIALSQRSNDEQNLDRCRFFKTGLRTQTGFSDRLSVKKCGNYKKFFRASREKCGIYPTFFRASRGKCGNHFSRTKLFIFTQLLPFSIKNI